ncbi:YqcC family protein [Marinomonas sp. TI.3.20]|uniref:YqcC family protein n=1 Tax=Marinomonas sp. TI.3.20 TaxID=3121296 RepID=UPI00311DF3C0
MNNEFENHYVLADMLLELEIALRECGVWECDQPSLEALASVEPFCIDTMDFSQWLRFVMIERFKSILEAGATLPTRCQISPMAAEAFKLYSHGHVSRIVKVIDNIDDHLNRQNQG